MSNFKKGNAYKAINYRTHEVHNVLCNSVRVNHVLFTFSDGTVAKFFAYDSPFNYTVTARNDKLHLLVKSA